MNAIDELTAGEVKDLAGRMGVSPVKLRASFAARELAERALRIRRPMDILKRATEHLPTFARTVLRDGDSIGTVATGLGLVGDDEPLSVARELLEQLALADQVPQSRDASRVCPSVSPNARANGRTGFGDAIYAILCEHGQLSYDELCEWLRETKYAASLPGLKTALRALVKSGAVRQVDGHGGPLYEVVRSAELQRD